MSKIGYHIALVNRKTDAYVRNMPGPKPIYTERVTFRCAPDMRAKLKDWAEAQGMTEQAAIRRAIATTLAKLKRRRRTKQGDSDAKPTVRQV